MTNQPDLPEYVDVAWVAKHLGKSNQNVDEAGRRALKPNYRGSMIRPDATVDGRPLWLKSRFEVNDNA